MLKQHLRRFIHSKHNQIHHPRVFQMENMDEKILFSFLLSNNILFKCGCCCLPQKHDIDLFMFVWEICLRRYCFCFVSILLIFLMCKKYRQALFSLQSEKTWKNITLYLPYPNINISISHKLNLKYS